MTASVNFSSDAWALEPGVLAELLDRVKANPDPEAFAARLGLTMSTGSRTTVRQGAAIIPIVGTIFRRESLWSQLFGFSVEGLALDLEAAARDESIHRIILEVDSPGGQATGISETAAMIREIAARKPVIAYVDGMAASAAYWLASAADRIVTSDTGLLGSIGVVGTYRPEKDAPIKIISSISPLKQATPDTEAGRAEMQRVVDDLASIFIRDLAKYRALSVEHIAQNFGKGGILVGAAAVRAGMADQVGSMASLFIAANMASLFAKAA